MQSCTNPHHFSNEQEISAYSPHFSHKHGARDNDPKTQQVVLMKRITRKLLLRVGTMTLALAAAVGTAYYAANQLPPSVPASVNGSDEPQVMILDAGHGGSC